MASSIIDDPVLDSILASGEFDSCLRSGCGGTSGGALAAFLVGRYFGLTEAGGAQLANWIGQARTAAGVLHSMPPGQPIPLGAIPLIPGIGGPSIQGGRIAVIIHGIWELPDGGPTTGFDSSVIFVNEPSMGDVETIWEDTAHQRFVYLGKWSDDDPRLTQPPTETVVFGVYRSY